jgi:hypothetical protein
VNGEPMSIDALRRRFPDWRFTLDPETGRLFGFCEPTPAQRLVQHAATAREMAGKLEEDGW